VSAADPLDPTDGLVEMVRQTVVTGARWHEGLEAELRRRVRAIVEERVGPEKRLRSPDAVLVWIRDHPGWTGPQRLIAHDLGFSRETVARAMLALREQGAIERVAPHCYRVADPDA